MSWNDQDWIYLAENLLKIMVSCHQISDLQFPYYMGFESMKFKIIV